MKHSRTFLAAVAVILLTAPTAFSQNQTGHGQAIVTILPSQSEKKLAVSPQDVQQLKINGRQAQVSSFSNIGKSPVQLVVLIDPAARVSVGTQQNAFKNFVHELPPNTKMAFAYMEYGRAALSGPFSSNPQKILSELQVPNGPPGVTASPYFSLSDLARNWPSHNRNARRIVIMVSDGIDPYYVRYDPTDPYVLSAIHDCVRADLVVYALYWKDQTRLDQFGWMENAGQNLLNEVADATGGYSYWQGFGNPVSFSPFLKNVRTRLENQYNLVFTAPVKNNPEVGRLQLNLNVPGAKTVDAPRQVLVVPSGHAQNQK